MHSLKVECKVGSSRSPEGFKWVAGEIIKEFPTYMLIQMKHFKECYLKVDQNDNWRIV